MALEEAVQERQRKVENEPESDVFEGSDDSDSDSDDGSDGDSGDDPSYDIVELTSSALSKLSLNKLKSSKCKDADTKKESGMEIKAVGIEILKLDEKDEKTYEKVEELIKGGDLEKLKVEQCKIYLRKYGLRLTGKKEVLISRIAEHREIIDGCGEKKYPPESFVLNCKGDACLGDVVIFEQNVYEMFSIASRSATGPSCGTRTVAGRIVKESYGAAKQQHTFTIEVLWSKGEKPWPPLHPFLIKGRNLYRIKTMRQRWADEGERQKVLQEKHARGFCARSSRDRRLQEKERRKNGMSIKGNKFTGDKENQHPQTAGVHQQIRNYKDQHRHEPEMRSNSTSIAKNQQIGNAAIHHTPLPSILGKLPKTAQHGIALQPHKNEYDCRVRTYVGTSQGPNSQNFRYIQHRDRQHHHHPYQANNAYGFQQSLESRNGGVYAARSHDHRHHYNNANHYSHHMHQTSTTNQFVPPLQQPYPGYQKKP